MKYLWLVGSFFFLINTNCLGQSANPKPKSCNKAKAELINTSDNSGNRQFEIATSNMVGPLKYTFYSREDVEIEKPLSMDLVRGLAEGTYYCIVSDSKGCQKKVESSGYKKTGIR